MTLVDAASQAGFSVHYSCPSGIEIEGHGDMDLLTALCEDFLNESFYSCIVVVHREGTKRTSYAVGTAGIQTSELRPRGESRHVDRIGISGYPGVVGIRCARGMRWIAKVWNGGHILQLGTFATPELAAERRAEYLAREKELA